MNRLSALFERFTHLLAGESYPLRQEGLELSCLLTPSRRRNLALQMVNRHLPVWAPALPHILHVGVTTMCNLHCPACPTGSQSLGRPQQHLDFDVYRRTIDELRGSLMLMLFWDWGEPLMHPRLPEMIEHAVRNRIMSVISTNGNVANSERQIERLIAARPSVLIVCVDGADQATYESYRVGGSLEKVLGTVRRLRRSKDAAGSLYPLIEFRSLAFRGNQDQMPELLCMAEDCGADLFSVKSLRPYDYRGADLDNTLVPLEAALRRYGYPNAGEPDAGKRTDFVDAGPLHCAKPHYSPTLNSDGTLAFCSYAVHPLEHFGNVSGPGFLKIWRSSHSRYIRRRFDRRHSTESCGTCYFRTERKTTILHQVPLSPLPPDIQVRWPKTRDEFIQSLSSEIP